MNTIPVVHGMHQTQYQDTAFHDNPGHHHMHMDESSQGEEMLFKSTVSTLRTISDIGGFPDTNTEPHPTETPAPVTKTKHSKKDRASFKLKQQQFSHSYYLAMNDNENMQYSYFHSRIKDKLVWYQDIEKLLPSTT
eukprot:305026_1